MKFLYCASVAAKLVTMKLGMSSPAQRRAQRPASTPLRPTRWRLRPGSSRERSEIAALGIRACKGRWPRPAPWSGDRQELVEAVARTAADYLDVTRRPEVMRELGIQHGLSVRQRRLRGQTFNVSISARWRIILAWSRSPACSVYLRSRQWSSSTSRMSERAKNGFVVIPRPGKSAIAGLRDHIARRSLNQGRYTSNGAIICELHRVQYKPLTNEAFYEAIFKAVDAGGIPGTGGRTDHLPQRPVNRMIGLATWRGEIWATRSG